MLGNSRDLRLKRVGAGANDIDGGVVLHPQEVYAFGLGCGLGGFGHGGGVRRGNINRRRGVRRNGDFQLQPPARFLPLADDAPVRRIEMGFHPGQIPGQRRFDDDVFEAGLFAVIVDSGQGLIEPRIEIAGLD